MSRPIAVVKTRSATSSTMTVRTTLITARKIYKNLYNKNSTNLNNEIYNIIAESI